MLLRNIPPLVSRYSVQSLNMISPLFSFAFNAEISALFQVLLNACPSLLTLTDHQGSLPSHHACIENEIKGLDTLLSFNPPKHSSLMLDLNQTDQTNLTCLHYAVAYNRVEAAAILTSKGAQASVEDGEGKTALDYALELADGRDRMLAVLRSELHSGSDHFD